MAIVDHFTSKEFKQITWSCDAVIIHHKFAITTARCATATKFVKVLVRIANEPITLGVVRTHVHPKYNSANGENDVALLETEGYIKFDGSVSPACMWYNQTHLPMFLSKPITSGGGMRDYYLFF
jgi:Trypsin